MSNFLKQAIDMPEELFTILKFLRHMDKTVSELQDHMENGDYDKKFDITFELNGKKLTLELNADLFNNVFNVIKEEMWELER